MKKPLFRMLWWDRVAPLGKPVVPLVYWMLIGSSKDRLASRPASGPTSPGIPGPDAPEQLERVVYLGSPEWEALLAAGPGIPGRPPVPAAQAHPARSAPR